MLTNLLDEQGNSSLLEVFGGQQWLLNNGIVSDAAVDTLLGYAYMQKGVRKVALKIDLDEKNEGKNPVVIYQVTIARFKKLRLSIVNSLFNRGLLGKVAGLFCVKILRMPTPGLLEYQIARYAKAFLPQKYKVNVEIV